MIRVMAVAVVLALCALGGAAIHPFGTVETEDGATLLSSASIDAYNLELLTKSCASCHSERANWPWYRYVAPASWIVEYDVTQAREHLNLSKWPSYSATEKARLLTDIGLAVRTNAMPPQRYLLLHPEGQLSATERESLYRWTRGERHRLRQSPVALPIRN